MVEANILIGGSIVVLNIIPFIIKKTNLLFLTGLISLIMIFLLGLI